MGLRLRNVTLLSRRSITSSSRAERVGKMRKRHEVEVVGRRMVGAPPLCGKSALPPADGHALMPTTPLRNPKG